MKFLCRHIFLLLCKLLRPVCCTGPTCRNHKLGPVQWDVCQTWLMSILSVILWCYWNEDKINDQGLDTGHDDLSILRRDAVFCLAIDCLSLCLGSQSPRRTWHPCLRPTNQNVRGLSHNHLIVYWLQFCWGFSKQSVKDCCTLRKWWIEVCIWCINDQCQFSHVWIWGGGGGGTLGGGSRKNVAIHLSCVIFAVVMAYWVW